MSVELQIKGARNLLINCGNIKPGEKLLIVSEDPALGWYDHQTSDIVAAEAAQMGAMVTHVFVGGPENTRCPKLAKKVEEHDCTIFFSRIGDQERFSKPKEGTRSIMCYIRDIEMLATPFATADYNAVIEFKDNIDDILFNAENIKITCPLGTSFSGSLEKNKKPDQKDVSVLRFPLGVATPIEAINFSGYIAMDRYLAPTGSKVYHPPYIEIKKPILAAIEQGRIVDFSGDQEVIDTIRNHYRKIGDEFNIDPMIVHSWHAGIHPGCDYKVPEKDNPDRWSNTVFCHPNYVHFHTCGNYAPGEISCTLPDHSIFVNGIKLWDKGRLQPQNFLTTKETVLKWRDLQNLFEMV